MSKSDKIPASKGIFDHHVAPERIIEDPHPVTDGVTQIDVVFPLESEPPLPVQLRRPYDAARNDSFRNFGINE